MTNKWKILIGIFACVALIISWFLLTPVDIRPALLKKGIRDQNYLRGKELLDQMQEAYGGKDLWSSYEKGSYSQIADWYENRLGLAGWEILPQHFEMTSTLGSDDAEFTLLNGPYSGQIWGIENWNTYRFKDGQKDFTLNENYQQKLIYKNYWFQFPFRISEAPIVAFGGTRMVRDKEYDLLYITWGSVAANGKYDQYVLYLDKETHLIEWLTFTLREKLKSIKITARFDDFKTIGGIVAPFSQFITVGAPGTDGLKMHENRYQWIQFGGERVMR